MSEMILHNSWAELYREALMESDPTKMRARIEEAYKAIHHRALELRYAGSGRHKGTTRLGCRASLSRSAQDSWTP